MLSDTKAYRKRANKESIVPLLHRILCTGILIFLILSDHSDTTEIRVHRAAHCARQARLNFKISLNSAAVALLHLITHMKHTHTARACMDECQRLSASRRDASQHIVSV